MGLSQFEILNAAPKGWFIPKDLASKLGENPQQLGIKVRKLHKFGYLRQGKVKQVRPFNNISYTLHKYKKVKQ